MTKKKAQPLLKAAFAKVRSIAKDLLFFIRQFLGHKKIVIITDKGISSLPVTFRLQAGACLVVLTFLLWVSFSTGKYFAYEGIISEKDRQIWTTHVTNENLQFQVSDLHQNLKELNAYFDNIRNYDQLAKRGFFGADETTGKGIQTADGQNDNSDSEEAARSILSNIRSKLHERIQSLETILEMTGLTMEEISSNNTDLKHALFERLGQESDKVPQDGSRQGGLFIPMDDEKDSFGEEIGYLLQLEKVVHSFPLASPLKRYWVSSSYGARVDPIKSVRAMHSGIDLVGGSDALVHSTAPGRIIKAEVSGAYGLMVEIDHGSGVSTRYGHLKKVYVKEGDKVERGQVVGMQGNSGRSTGEHLHYEVRYNGKAYDPKNFLKAGKYVF